MAEIKLNGKRYDVTLNPNTVPERERFLVVGLDSEEVFVYEGAAAFAQGLLDAQETRAVEPKASLFGRLFGARRRTAQLK